jgi:hypothetical protein
MRDELGCTGLEIDLHRIISAEPSFDSILFIVYRKFWKMFVNTVIINT